MSPSLFPCFNREEDVYCSSTGSQQRTRGTTLHRSARGRTGDKLLGPLAQIKGIPSGADCLEIFDRYLTNGIIVIQFTPREEDFLIVECGPLFRDAYGRNPVDLAAKKYLPSSTDRGLIFWRVAAEMRKAIADVGEFTNLHGEEVLYRSVILPISEDGKRITHLMVTFSYKTTH